jgi:threonine/homoserine/homoserine lactone efflux protein
VNHLAAFVTVLSGRRRALATAPGVGSGLQRSPRSALFCAMTLAWLVAYAVVVARAHATLMRPRVRRVVDTLTGVTLVAFGARPAAEQR